MKKFGVKLTLPKGNPMSAPHLLGERFAAERWFESEQARENFLALHQKEFVYYRRGDRPTYNYELINS